MNTHIVEWVGLLGLFLGLIVLDQKVFNKHAHLVSKAESMKWFAFYFVIALLIGAYIWLAHGAEWGRQYFAGFITEKSMSFDNIWVILLIVNFFAIPAIHQHRLLYWGIMGAMVLRGVFIGAGVFFVSKFAWVLYVFGGILAYTTWKLAVSGDEKFDPEKSLGYKLARKFLPMSSTMDGDRFFTHDQNGRRFGTPYLVALIVVEISDIIFAFDSLPAIFGISQEPFIIYSSNLAAIFGLRSLYFFIAATMMELRYLKPTLVAILGFISLKLLLPGVHDLVALGWLGEKISTTLPHHISTGWSLAVLGGLLVVGIGASLLFPERKPEVIEIETNGEVAEAESDQSKE